MGYPSFLEQQFLWRDKALCVEVEDQAIFFEEKGKKGNARAKEICKVCSVKDECLEFALTTNQELHIWGGATARERRLILHERGLKQGDVGFD